MQQSAFGTIFIFKLKNIWDLTLDLDIILYHCNLSKTISIKQEMWDLKLLLYAIHPGWHESVSHDSQTAERNPEKRLECENHSSRPFTKISSDNSVSQ